MSWKNRVAGLISGPMAVACGALLILPPVSAQKAGLISRSLPPASIVEQPVRRGVQPTTLEAKGGAAFKWNDSLVTGPGGRLRAQLNDGSILSLGSAATLKVVQHDEKSQQSSFELTAGRVRAQVVRLARPDSKFEVRTNTAVCGVLGTDEVVDASDPTATVVIAISGIVVVRSSDPNVAGSVQLTAGQMTTVNQGRAPGQPQQASPEQLSNAVMDTDGSTNPEPQIGDLTPQTQIGQQITLDGRASSGGVGSVQSYLWNIPRRPFTSTDPVIVLDTNGWQVGEYDGTLAITSTNGRTASVSFRFRLVDRDRGSPEETIANLALAYEALQVRNFMNLFDSARYSGYAALEQSISQSFSNIQENRVFVRRASGQTIEGGPGTNPSAIYQVDFEIRFTPKNTAFPGGAANPAAVPNMAAARSGANANTGVISGSAGAVATFVILRGPNNFQTFAQTAVNNTSYTFTNVPDGVYTVSPLRNGFTFSPPSRTVTITGSNAVTGVDFTAQAQLQIVREQASLRMEYFQGRGWLITDIQGSLGSAGLVGIPGTTCPACGNSPGDSGVPGGGGLSGFAVQAPGTFSVVGGGAGGTTTLTITPQNGFIGPVNISFLLPPGVTVTGPTTINITGPNPVTVQYTFSVAAGTQAGNILVPFTVTSGSTTTTGTVQTQQGAVTLQVQPLTVQVTGNGATAGGPLNFFAGGSASTTIQVSPNVPVTLNVSPGAGLTATLGALQNGVATVTINSTNSTLGPGTVQVTANQTGSAATATATIFVNRNSPISSFSGPTGNVTVSPGQPASVQINVQFAQGFTGPVVVTAPVVAGVVFTPTSVTLNASGNATFTATATGPEVLPQRRGSGDVIIGGNFNIQAGVFSAQLPVTFDVLPAFDFSISGGTLTISQGGTLTLNVVVTQTQGNTPQQVTVSAQGVPGGLTVTGGGTVNGGGSVAFSVAAAANAPLGNLTFNVQGVGPGNLTRTALVTVSVVSGGTFSLSAPSSVSIVDGSTGTVTVQVVPGGNFNSAVAMTTSATGATVSGPSTIAAGGSGDYTVTPTANSGSITFTGNALGITQTVTVSFTRNAGFSISGGTLNGFLGGTFTATVTITRSGNNGAITVTSVSAPSGVTVTPQSVSVPAGGTTATFSVAVGNSALGGNINFSAVATGGTLPVTGAATLTLGNPFSLTAAPITGSAGSTTNLVVAVSRAAGFTGAVDVALGGGTASGVVASPAQVTVGPGQTQANFVLTLSPNATSGTLSFNGTSAGLTFTAGVTVALTVGSSFTLTGPSSLPDLSAGGTQTTAVTVTFGTGFTGPVNLSATATGGLGAVLSPTSFTSSGVALVTVEAPLGSSGAQNVTVTATFGTVTRTLNISVQVVAPSVPFTVSITPVSVFRGTSGSVVASVAFLTPIPGGVTAVATGVPVGLSTVSSSVPAILSTTGSFTFNFTASSAGPGPASALIPIQFTGGGFSQTVNATINLLDPFTVTVSPTNMFIGTTGTVSIAVTMNAPGVFVSPGSPSYPPGFSSAGSPSPSFLSSNGTFNFPVSAPSSISSGVATFSFFSASFSTTVNVTINAVPAFTATATNPNVTMFYGTTTNFIIHVNYSTSPAFTGQVAHLTSSGPPCCFNIADVSPAGGILTSSGDIVISMTDNDDHGTLSPSTVIFHVYDTTGATSAMVSFNVTWVDPFSITFSSVPSSVAVGATGSYTVNVVGAPGFTGAVTVQPYESTFGAVFTPPSAIASVVSGSTVPVSFNMVFSGTGGVVTFGASGSIGGGAFGTSANASTTTTVTFPPPLGPLVMRAEDLRYTPSLPREGETVRFRARISNRGANASEGLSLALMRGDTVLASRKVDLDAGRSTTAELEWKAERGSLDDLRLALVGAPGVSISLRNLAVAKGDEVGVSRRDRATITARNEDCAGLRLRGASQSSCGGSADLEFMPAITAAGTLEVRVNLPEGGINDLGAMPLGTGSTATLPQDVSLQSQTLFVEGHTYLVKTRRGTALVRVARIRSSINPRIAVITGSGAPVSSGAGGNDRAGRTGSGQRLPTTPTDPLTDARDQERNDRLLSNAQITVDLELILFEGTR